MLSNFKWYRKWKKGLWYKHKNNYNLPGLIFEFMWLRYGKINRYTDVVKIEHYLNRAKKHE